MMKRTNEYMEVTTRPRGQNVFKVMNYEFKCVNKFKYLGMNSNQITAELNPSAGTANCCYHRLEVMLKSRYLGTRNQVQGSVTPYRNLYLHMRVSWTLTVRG
jgi:hypothetical protein